MSQENVYDKCLKIDIVWSFWCHKKQLMDIVQSFFVIFF